MPHNSQKQKLILAIAPTIHGFGFAIFNDPQNLIDWGAVTIRINKNNNCLKKICQRIDFYSPDVLIVEDYAGEGSRRCKRVQTLIQRILKEGQKRKIQSSAYSRSTIRGVFEQFHARTKYEISKKITEWLPALQARLPPESKPWMSEDYRMGIFDAVALALTFYYLSE